MTEKTESRRSLSIRRIMNYTIFNDFLEVTVSDVGAELMSVKSKKDGTEYLWQGDPAFWAGRAYNLSPYAAGSRKANIPSKARPMR